MFDRNKDKLFIEQTVPPLKRKKNTESKVQCLSQMMEIARKNEQPSVADTEQNVQRTREIILEAELDFANRELKELNQTVQYMRNKYTVSALEGDVIWMETGLPTKEVFNIVVNHALRFKDSVNYFAGWNVESISFEDQIFITLMKVRQNYTQLHLAQLFHCGVATISNIVITFTHVLHEIEISAPSFRQFESCWIVIVCTDIEVAGPSLMSQENALYSSYRRINSFKVIIGVAPNGVITYVSWLYPGSISDKTIVQQSGLLNHLTAGDMILADKGFLIQDIVPHGVCVNIPPFLNNETFTESEVRKQKPQLKPGSMLKEPMPGWKTSKYSIAMLTFCFSYVLHL